MVPVQQIDRSIDRQTDSKIDRASCVVCSVVCSVVLMRHETSSIVCHDICKNISHDIISFSCEHYDIIISLKKNPT
jgi:hypothetical protein